MDANTTKHHKGSIGVTLNFAIFKCRIIGTDILERRTKAASYFCAIWKTIIHKNEVVHSIPLRFVLSSRASLILISIRNFPKCKRPLFDANKYFCGLRWDVLQRDMILSCIDAVVIIGRKGCWYFRHLPLTAFVNTNDLFIISILWTIEFFVFVLLFIYLICIYIVQIHGFLKAGIFLRRLIHHVIG